MPNRKSRSDQPSSLELFLLLLLSRRSFTLYDLRCVAGISVGSSQPALRRLEQTGLVQRRAGKLHGKEAWRTTAAGVHVLANAVPSDDSGSNVEELIRIAIIRGAAATSTGFKSGPKRPTGQLMNADEIAARYREAIALIRRERQKAENRALLAIRKLLS